MKCYCLWLSCGMGGIMYMCHQEVTSQHGAHISILIQPGSLRGTVCNFQDPLPSLFGPEFLIPLAHIIARVKAMTRGLLVTPLAAKLAQQMGGTVSWSVAHGAADPTLWGEWVKLCAFPTTGNLPNQRWGNPYREKRFWLPRTPLRKLTFSWPIAAVHFSSQTFLLLFPSLFLPYQGCRGNRRRRKKNH